MVKSRFASLRNIVNAAVIVAIVLASASPAVAETETLEEEYFSSSFNGADWICTDDPSVLTPCSESVCEEEWCWKFINSGGIGKNGMEACKRSTNDVVVLSNDATKWLATPVIDVTGLVQVDISFIFDKTPCASNTCDNTFAMYALPVVGGVTDFDGKVGIDTGISKNAGQIGFQSEAHIFAVSAVASSHIRIAWFDVGGCVQLDNVVIKYNYCEAQTINGVSYPRTLSDDNKTVTTTGTCASGFPQDSSFVCEDNGQWLQVGTSPFCSATAPNPNSGGSGGGGGGSGGGGGANTAVIGGVVAGVLVIALVVGALWWRRTHGGGGGGGGLGKPQVAPLMASNPGVGINGASGYAPGAQRSQAPVPVNLSYKDLQQKDWEDREYEDPTNYEDPTDLLDMIKELAVQFPREAVKQLQVIGSGEFGEVWHAQLNKGGTFVDCAVKTCRAGSGRQAKVEFLKEAAVIGQFRHDHVLSLLGVVITGEPVLLITELMTQGSLNRFLLARANQIAVTELLQMAVDVSSGMQYLASKGFVHRDLAARNVLVAHDGHCKVADFGLSKAVDDDSDYFISQGGKIPIRWTAPEAVVDRKYTSSSDVWSFGILLWEIFSFGARPYDGMTNIEVVKKVDAGYRLPKPAQCPVNVYELMLDCWQLDRKSRPTFQSLHDSAKAIKDEVAGCGDYDALEEPANMTTDAAGYLVPEVAPAGFDYATNPAPAAVPAASGFDYASAPTTSTKLVPLPQPSAASSPAPVTGATSAVHEYELATSDEQAVPAPLSDYSLATTATPSQPAVPEAGAVAMSDQATVLWEYNDPKTGTIIAANTAVTVVNASDRDWTLVKLANGQDVYVPAKFLLERRMTTEA